MGRSGDATGTLGQLGEDAVLAAVLTALADTADGLVGPGDDAAVVAISGESVVATTDSMIRGRDWRDEWSSGHDVGVKAARQNLADIAAMGARPTGLLVSLLADPDTDVAWVSDLARGIGDAARAARTPVVGGDLSSAPPGVLAVSVTALGSLDGIRPVLRSGACVGDVVAVCGRLGMAYAGWLLLRDGRIGELDEAVTAQRRPDPPLTAGPQASRSGATAMLDVSDGLLRDAARIATDSKVRLDLSSAALAADVARLEPTLGAEVARDCVLTGGEDHALLATFPDAPPPGWRTIGTVTAGSGVSVDGIPEPPRGWDHFQPGA